MPLPVSLAYGALILLPTVKLIAALISRSSWTRLRALQQDLEADPELTARDRRDVRSRVEDGFGHPALLLLPVVVPIAMPVMAISLSFIDRSDLEKQTATAWAKRADRLHGQRILYDVDLAEVDSDLMRVSARLRGDPRFAEIMSLTTPLAFLRYPVASLLTLAMVVLTGWIPMITLGIQYGGGVVFRALRDVARTNTIAPLFETKRMLGV